MKKLILLFLVFICIQTINAQWIFNYQTLRSAIVQVASAPDDDNFWFITNFDTLYKTSNGGVSWTIVPRGSVSFNPAGLFVVNKDTAFKTSLSVAYRTLDGGNSWSLVYSGSGLTYPVIRMKNNSEGVLAYTGVLYKTTDGGASWNNSNITQPPLQLTSSSGKGNVYNNGDDLWVALQNAGVAYSSDFGVSWSLASNTGLSFTTPGKIFFGSPQFGIATRNNGPFIYVTKNGTQSWLQTDNSQGANEDVVINNSHCWYIPNPADHFFIKYSADSGATWTQQLFDASGFNILERSRTGNTIWAGTTTGKIYKYNDIITHIPDTTEVPFSFSLEQNFPNPFNPVTDLEFGISELEFVSLKIYDVLGNEVRTLVNEIKPSGSYDITFDGTNFAGGIYFYKLTAGNYSKTKRMILLK